MDAVPFRRDENAPASVLYIGCGQTMNKSIEGLGPLQNRARVVVIGGGPGGVGVALALQNFARQAGHENQITLFEGKIFAGEQHFNQCVGVLSPPIENILQDSLGVPFPRHLIQREITGYILHSDDRAIALESDDPPAYSVRRVQFDDYLLEQARARELANCRAAWQRKKRLEISVF